VSDRAVTWGLAPTVGVGVTFGSIVGVDVGISVGGATVGVSVGVSVGVPVMVAVGVTGVAVVISQLGVSDGMIVGSGVGSALQPANRLVSTTRQKISRIALCFILLAPLITILPDSDSTRGWSKINPPTSEEETGCS